MKAIKQFVFGISILLVFFFIKNPQSLYHYFHNTLGRALILFYIVVLTSYSPIFGLLFSVLLIVLYHSKVEPKVYPSNIEGMENKSASPPIPQKKAPVVPTVKSSITSSNVNKDEKEDISHPEKSTPTTITKATTANANATANVSSNKEGYDNIRSSLSPASFGRERDNMIRLEKMIRPKPSKSYMIMNKMQTSEEEPLPYYFGKHTSLQTSFLP